MFPYALHAPGLKFKKKKLKSTYVPLLFFRALGLWFGFWVGWEWGNQHRKV